MRRGLAVRAVPADASARSRRCGSRRARRRDALAGAVVHDAGRRAATGSPGCSRPTAPRSIVADAGRRRLVGVCALRRLRASSSCTSLPLARRRRGVGPGAARRRRSSPSPGAPRAVDVRAQRPRPARSTAAAGFDGGAGDRRGRATRSGSPTSAWSGCGPAAPAAAGDDRRGGRRRGRRRAAASGRWPARPRLAARLFTDAERDRPVELARGAVRRQGGRGQGARRAGRAALARRRGRQRRARPAAAALHGGVAAEAAAQGIRAGTCRCRTTAASRPPSWWPSR